MTLHAIQSEIVAQITATEREQAAKAILAAELRDEKRLLPANRRRALRTRANKARNFPTNTCPASRHVHMMADYLSTVGYYHMFEDEPLHAAGSLYAVVTALWEARTRIAALEAASASPVGSLDRRAIEADEYQRERDQ